MFYKPELYTQNNNLNIIQKTYHRCNNNCIFCYACLEEDERGKELSTEEFISIIDSYPENVKTISFTTYEPTLRKDLFSILKYTRKKLPNVELHLVTNGRRFGNEAYAKKFCKLGLGNVNVSIPIHSHDSKVHDELTRVAGSFEQTMNGIKNLIKHNQGYNLEIRVLVHRFNYKNLKQILEFINKDFPKIDRIVLVYIAITGEAMKNCKRLELGLSELQPYLADALDTADTKKIELYQFPLCILPERHWGSNRGMTIPEEDTIFPQKCDKCIVKSQCSGLWKNEWSSSLFEELHPITKLQRNTEYSGRENNLPLCIAADNSGINKSNLPTANKIKPLFCISCKYVSECDGIPEEYAKKRGIKGTKPIKDLPEEVKIELTYDCNKDCSFCFNKSIIQNNRLAKEDIFRVLDKISKSGIKAVRFTGGEPLLHKNIGEILKYAKSKGLYAILNTNGSLLNEKNLPLLKNIDDLLVSFHYLSELEEKKNLFKDLRKFNLVLRCCTIATKGNIAHLEEFYKFFDTRPIDDWFLLRPVPSKNNPFPINRRDIAVLTEKILNLNEKYHIKARIANSVPFCAYDKEKVSKICVGGKYDNGYSRIVVGADGSIKTDYFSDICLGSIQKDEILDCWNSEYMLNKRGLKELPRLCLNCSYAERCMGGLEFAAKLSNTEIDPLVRGDFRILFINPLFKGFTLPIEPLALEYMASFLESRGYECRIIDCNLGCDNAALLSDVGSFKPSLTGISTFSLQIEEAYKLGNLIKQKFPNIKLVYGGVHSTFVYGTVDTTINPEEPFIKGNADFVISGEGEMALWQLAKTIEENDLGDINKINGLSYKRDGKIVLSREKSKIEDLDTAPFPARDITRIREYKNDIHILPYAKDIAVDVITSRGCPFNCSYCTSPSLYGRKVRFRSPENVVSEIEEITDYYGIRNIHFHDDCFLLDSERAKEICQLIINHKLDIKWICLASIPSLLKSEKILPIMKKAGCVGIEIGLESCDENVLRAMNKQQSIEEVLQVDNLLKRNGIAPLYLMISFHPAETLNTSNKNVQLLKKIVDKKIKIVDYLKAVHLPYSFGQFATPYKGTEFEKTAKRDGICFIESGSDYNRQRVNFIPYSFLNDIPIKIKDLNEESFYKEIDKFKESIDYYLKGTELIGYGDYNRYIEFLYGIYSKINGEKTIEELLKDSDLRFGSLALKFLAMFDFIDSKK